MKTSFYFVLWIIIYPVLDLFNNSFINNNAFIVALGIVWGLSWVLNKILPQTLTYERVLEIAPLLEEVYTGNVTDFKKRVTRDMWIESVISVYFIVTVIVIAYAIFTAGVNDWLALAVFIFLSFGTIKRSINLVKAHFQLKANPTPEECVVIVEDTYKMDYVSFYESHSGLSYQEILPERPRHFKVFKLVSIVFAIISFCLGLLFILASGGLLIREYWLAQHPRLNYTIQQQTIALGVMYLLYGSLAAYFGIKDFLSCFHKQHIQQTL